MTNTVRRHSQPGARRCAFTGYRPQKMPFGFDEADPRCIDFKKRLKDTIHALYYCGYKHFISGGALSMDMFAAEAVVELRKEYPEIVLEMVSPFDAQAAKWSPEHQARHDRLFELADITTATGMNTPREPCSSATAIWSTTPICCSLPTMGNQAVLK